jgi:hypothetical protein
MGSTKKINVFTINNVYFTNISLIFLNHNNSTDTANRFRLLLYPLQVSPQLLLLQQEPLLLS